MNRMRFKHQLSLTRGSKCELCGINEASDLHEIFCRSLTVGNPVAREISYQKELCSLLCRDCHQKADFPENRAKLLDKNIERYGYECVFDRYCQMQAAMNYPVPIEFPEAVYGES